MTGCCPKNITNSCENSSGGVSTNIYTSDGTLSGNRIVNLDSQNLSFTSGDNFEIESNNLTLNIGNVILTQTPTVDNTNGNFLVRDGTTGEIELRTNLPSGTATNIYNTDGTLTGSRTIDMGNLSMTFLQNFDFLINGNNTTFEIDDANEEINMSAESIYLLQTPPTDNTNDYLMVRSNIIGEIQLRDASSIYDSISPESDVGTFTILAGNSSNINVSLSGLSRAPKMVFFSWDTGAVTSGVLIMDGKFVNSATPTSTATFVYGDSITHTRTSITNGCIVVVSGPSVSINATVSALSSTTMTISHNITNTDAGNRTFVYQTYG